jgi:exodeoxyribonuclease VII small subunit
MRMARQSDVAQSDVGEPDARHAGAPAAEPTISYEQARKELADVVKALESGGQPLEESLNLWQRGEELARLCQRWLQDARARLDEAIAESDAPQTAGDLAE